MSDRVIYKYKLKGDVAMVPVGIVRHVAAQQPDDELPTIWVEHTWPAPSETMEINIVGTGHHFVDDFVDHVGSAVCADGDLVWHVYCVKPSAAGDRR